MENSDDTHFSLNRECRKIYKKSRFFSKIENVENFIEKLIILIFQAMTLKEYPAQLSLTTLICMMGALQGTVVTLLIENGKSGIWSMHKRTEIIATLYSVRNVLIINSSSYTCFFKFSLIFFLYK